MKSVRHPANTITAIILLAMVAFVGLQSCSSKKNTAATRNYQAFLTRYNIYYNGDEHYKETLKLMEKNYEDDYTQRLFIHPAEARNYPKSPQPEGNFDRSIEKAQKAIQLHTVKKKPKRQSGKGNDPAYKAWLKRGEYNPFLHNAWLMMGRAQYMNGDFAGAASTFMYIAKNFNWLPATVTEASIWQARSYCGLNWLFEAETVISKIKPDDLTSKKLKELYALTRADIDMRSHEYANAVPHLRQAIRYASGQQKIRLNFLLGQLYAAQGEKKAAYDAFKRAGSSLNASYRTKLNARIKQSEVYDGINIEPEVNALRRMTRYDRNAQYLDQIYYAIGNLYLSRQDTLKAIDNYKLAAEKSTRNGIEKAISQLTLGGLYYDRHNYDLAQPCYAEAVPLLPDDYTDYAKIKRRSDVLDELAVYSQNVTLQDSLLRLAAMTSEQRLEVINKIIDELKKKEKEEAEAAALEEYRAQAEQNQSNLKSNAATPNTFTLNTDDSWYFYNTATRNAGKTEFQRQWGSRKLEDDWRRRNKSSFSMADFSTDDDDDDDNDDNEAADGDNPDASTLDGDKKRKSKDGEPDKENDPHYPEYYLKQIPQTDDDILTSNDVIQEGLYNMGIILKNKLYDFPAAATEFDRLLERYPDNIYRLDTYYNLYLMWMQAGRPDEAEKWRLMVLSEFPDSRYGLAMQDPAYLDKLCLMEQRQESLYAATFANYIENRNAEVHQAYADMMREYPLSPIMPKFMFLHALAYVTENRPDDFNQTLKEMLDRYPNTDMTPLAASYLKGMAAGRQLHAGLNNTRGMLWDTRLLADSVALANGDEGPIEFTLNPAGPHSYLLLYERSQVAANALLYQIARHNFNSYTVRDFDLETYAFGSLGILRVKGLDTQADAERYRRQLHDDPDTAIPTEVRPVVILDDNFELMLRRGASFEQYFEFIGETELSEVHESVLPPNDYPSADEIYPQPSEDPDADTPDEETEEAEETEPVEPDPNAEPAGETPVVVPVVIDPIIPIGSEGDDLLDDD